MAKINRYEDLIAWQKSFELVIQIYEVTKEFPSEEKFGLTQQARRAAVSIPANIAEGWGRYSRMEYIRFLDIARGSVFELQTHMRIADRLGYLSQPQGIIDRINEVERLVSALIRSLRNKNTQAPNTAA